MPLAQAAETLRLEGQPVNYVAEGALAGLIGVADPSKASTPEAIRARCISRLTIRNVRQNLEADSMRACCTRNSNSRLMLRKGPTRLRRDE